MGSDWVETWHLSPLSECIEGNLRRFLECFEMTVECCQWDTGARGRHGDKTIGKAASQPFTAKIESEPPGFSPQFSGLGYELENMEEVAEHGKFLVRFRPLHKFRKDDAGAAYLLVIELITISAKYIVFYNTSDCRHSIFPANFFTLVISST